MRHEAAIVSLRKIDARLSGADYTEQVTTSPNRSHQRLEPKNYVTKQRLPRRGRRNS